MSRLFLACTSLALVVAVALTMSYSVLVGSPFIALTVVFALAHYAATPDDSEPDPSSTHERTPE